MFYDKDNNFNYEVFRQFKQKGYLDIWSYDIYDLSNDNIKKKIMDNMETIKKSTRKKIFIINPQYIANKNERFLSLPIPDVIIHDECHTITGDMTEKFLKHYKNNNHTNFVGLSATPIRYIKQQPNYDIINKIFSNNIIPYENITAIKANIILNIEIFWFDYIKAVKEKEKEEKYNTINLTKCIIKILDYLPHKKGLIWTSSINHANKLYKKMNEIFEEHNINIPLFIDHSQTKEHAEMYEFTDDS